jgi:hypothetical protein
MDCGHVFALGWLAAETAFFLAGDWAVFSQVPAGASA